MKATFNKEYRKLYTLEDLDIAKKVIESVKEDSTTVSEYAEMAISEALKDSGDWLTRVIEAKAETAKNCRTWNAYCEGSETMDIWIEATAKTAKGFIEVGAYLTDIWQTGAENYKDQMWIQYYKKSQM